MNEWTKFEPNWTGLSQKVEGKYKIEDNKMYISCTVKREPVIIHGLPTVIRRMK